MKKTILLLLLGLLLLTLSSCAAGPNELANTIVEEGKLAGFWQGLWHGIICPVTFIISLFNDNVGIYEAYNNGNWYNLGFVFGALIIGGGGGGSACSKKRR